MAVNTELKETNNYARRNKYENYQREKDGTFTDYAFVHGGYEDKRRYLNVRLRNGQKN